MERLALTATGTLDDDLVAGAGQTVQSAIAHHGIIKETQPLVHGSGGGDGEVGVSVTRDYQLGQVGRLSGREATRTRAAQDEQIWDQAGTEFFSKVWSTRDGARVWKKAPAREWNRVA